MDKQEIDLIVCAITSGLRAGGDDSKYENVANAFRLLRTVLFDCFKSEHKPGVDILLNYLKSSGNSSTQLASAIGVLGKHRKAEIITYARELLSLEAVRNLDIKKAIELSSSHTSPTTGVSDEQLP